MSTAMQPLSWSSGWTPKLILFFNLLENFAFLTSSSSDLILFKDPVSAVFSPRYGSKLLVAICTLVGTPVIFAGFMGVLTRSDKLVWPYFYYALVCLLLYTGFVVDLLLEYRACGSKTAGLCGPLRGLEISGLALAAGLHLCTLHPLYYYCGELRSESRGGSPGYVVKDRSEDRKQAFKHLRDGPLASIQGYLVGEYGSIFEAAIGMSNTAGGGTSSGVSRPHLPNMRLV